TRFSRDWSSDVCSSDLRGKRAVGGIHALQLARDEPICRIADTRTSVLFGDGRTQQAELGHLAGYLLVEDFILIAFESARLQLRLCVLAQIGRASCRESAKV